MKKGQVTIFVIFAIIIVASLLALFFLVAKPRLVKVSSLAVSEEIRSCSKKIVLNKVEDLIENGPASKLKIMYRGENYTYLCYADTELEKCYTLYPDLKETFEKQIVSQTKDNITNCFEQLKQELKNRNYLLTYTKPEYSVSILPGRIKVNLQSDVSVQKDKTAITLRNFNTNILIDLNSFSEIAARIVNDESDHCYFDHQNFIKLHPDFDIIKISYMGSKLYRIIERQSQKEFKFAVRSCSGGF